MQRRIFVVHGWDAAPDREWFPWLRGQLEKHGFEVIIPAMPDTEHPVIDAWVETLSAVVGPLRESDIFIGHSIGCQTILRLLQRQESSVAGLICVAGWFTLRNLENDEEERIARPWVETPIDFAAVSRVVRRTIAIFSDTDPYVELASNQEVFERQLGAAIIVEHDKGHFSETNGIYELPVVRDMVLQLANIPRSA